MLRKTKALKIWSFLTHRILWWENIPLGSQFPKIYFQIDDLMLQVPTGWCKFHETSLRLAVESRGCLSDRVWLDITCMMYKPLMIEMSVSRGFISLYSIKWIFIIFILDALLVYLTPENYQPCKPCSATSAMLLSYCAKYCQGGNSGKPHCS